MPENSSNKKESAKGKRRQNLIILLCLAVFVYLVVYCFIYLYDDSDSLYEVTAGSCESEFESSYTALALREETVVTAGTSGYINFFIGDSMPVSVGSDTYVIYESDELSALLEEAAANSGALDDEALSVLKDIIYDFDLSYNEQDYDDVYSFKSMIQSEIMDIINSTVFDSLSDTLSESDSASYVIGTSEISGIIQHSTDGFEAITLEDIESSLFKKDEYVRTTVSSNDLVEKGSAIYKVITSEEWSLVFQIEDAAAFEDLTTLEITFLADGVSAEGDFELLTTAGNTYGVLSLEKYMIRYISDRYLQIEIYSDSADGLMIPKTSVTTKQFYTIPVEYLTTGGNSSVKGFMLQTETDDGETTVSFITPGISKTTSEYCYVSTDDLNAGDILVAPDSSDTYQVNEKENVDVVYEYSSGAYSCVIVNIIGENGEYYIVEDGTSYSISMYEQILENASDYEGD